MYSRQEQWKLLDSHRRRMYVRFELKNRIYKSIIYNKSTPLSIRYWAMFKLSTLPRIASITKIVNRCVRSGRAHMVIHKAQLSRFAFRFESYNGSLPGVRRHSW